MRMNVPCKLVTSIPESVIDNIENAFVEEDWFAKDYRSKLPNMTRVNSLPVMHSEMCYVNSDTNDVIRSIKPMPLYDKYYPLIVPVLDELRKHYEFKQYAAFFARLAPNSSVGEHSDFGKFLSLCHRIHIPIITNDKVFYKIETTRYSWNRGEVHEFDNMRSHSCINESDVHRVHLIVNLYNLSEEELKR